MIRCTALVLVASCAASHPSWQLDNAESHVSVEAGKHVVQLAPIGGNRKGSNVGMALVEGETFTTGQIDVDLRGAAEGASFVGIAFSVVDATHYEAVYFRPFRFLSTDPVERTHAVQYVAWPENTWEALRTRARNVRGCDRTGAGSDGLVPRTCRGHRHDGEGIHQPRGTTDARRRAAAQWRRKGRLVGR